ncbi:hypothetical protein AWC22_07095 [Mycobacterium riyadhense]|uniref:Uncharacterized protein n=1 Tax=Mycobacterium riyadhense TaxID=486698 RepID=A0A1X2AXC1_9MYCO|nr:hypothetical protein AWC22_07095 [Mycobacterium riyadhense]
MHAGPPVGRGAAVAPGLSANAAPHSPALASTVMLQRSNMFKRHSLVSVLMKHFGIQTGAAELYRCPEGFL